MSEENNAVVQRMIREVWNGGNLAVVDELVDPDYAGHDPAWPGPILGPAGFKQWVGAARALFPDFSTGIEEMVSEGDTVAARIIMSGTHDGTLPGFPPPTGRKVTLEAMFFRRLTGGKFMAGWDVANMLGLLQQIGAGAPSA